MSEQNSYTVADLKANQAHYADRVQRLIQGLTVSAQLRDEELLVEMNKAAAIFLNEILVMFQNNSSDPEFLERVLEVVRSQKD